MGSEDFRALDDFDWYGYCCHACGERGWLGRDRGQSVEDFGLMAMMILGDPPVCADCRADQRGLMNRHERRALRRRAGRRP